MPAMTRARSDTPFYFPLTDDYSVQQDAPEPIRADQYGNGPIDGQVFQFAGDGEAALAFKRSLLADHADRHVGRSQLGEAAESVVCDFIAAQLLREHPDRFHEADLRGRAFESLAMCVPEDLAITCVRYDQRGNVAGDWLAAVHVCMPSGWSPADVLGRSFAQVHRTVQVPKARHFLLQDGKVSDYVGQMLRCARPHGRFIWTLQVGDARNRNPQTRRPPPALQVDSAAGTSNVFFRVERQTITGFADSGVSLFTIRTYLYPLAGVIADPARRAALKRAVAAMPRRVVAYKGLADELVEYIACL